MATRTLVQTVTVGAEGWNISIRPMNIKEIDVVCLKAPELSLNSTSRVTPVSKRAAEFKAIAFITRHFVGRSQTDRLAASDNRCALASQASRMLHLSTRETRSSPRGMVRFAGTLRVSKTCLKTSYPCVTYFFCKSL